MEEFIGKTWHRWISRRASTSHAVATVTLDEVRASVGVLFRALGGDGGLRVEAAQAGEHGARRTWLQRIAGSHQQVILAWRDEQTLRLPPAIDLFADAALNRELYLWLAALAATDAPRGLPWFAASQQLTLATLARLPGLRGRYQRLVDAQLALRPAPARLPPAEAAQERAIQAALRDPGSMAELPACARAPQPVYLWLHPAPPFVVRDAQHSEDGDAEREGSPNTPAAQAQAQARKRAERVDMPKGDDGLLAIRMENIFSWAEYSKVDRCTDDDPDDNAASAAQDMDVMHVARDSKSIASRLRFDLDLPAAEYDDLPLGAGIRLPEWDYRKRLMQPNHCCVQPMVAREATPQPLPDHLQRTARLLRRQLEVLAHTRTWLHGQPDGMEIDLDAWQRHLADRQAGAHASAEGLYRDLRPGQRDLACLLLADLSLSTDSAVNNDARVIDVIRDSLFLFAEALRATGDRFALYGFSSRRREQVRLHVLKSFAQRYDAAARGRIQAIKPGYYTRMGAAIRYSTQLLRDQPASKQVLLLLTDGKPNDLDKYEGRYGAEDTRMAIIEARKQGLHPFCVTIDPDANQYLPHLFGPGGYTVLRRPEELPRQLPLLYARLTA